MGRTPHRLAPLLLAAVLLAAARPAGAATITVTTRAQPLAATGSNLIGANGGCAAFFPEGSPNVNGDFAGTLAAPIDPLLQPLANHGGPTHVHRPSVNRRPATSRRSPATLRCPISDSNTAKRL